MSPEEFVQHLGDFEDELENGSFRDPLENMMSVFHAGVLENLFQAVDEDGQPWPPRKDPGDGHPLLVDTTAMRTAAIEAGALGNLSEVENREFETGVDSSVVEYAAFHQRGTKKMPRRQYYYANEDTLEMMDDILLEFIVGLI